MHQYTRMDFYVLLYKCYFHPSREYPNERVKFLAELAMLYLWDTSQITVWGIAFKRDFVRHKIIEEMTPDDLDRAIEETRRKKWKITFCEFAELIFQSVLFSDILMKSQFEQTYGRYFGASILKQPVIKLSRGF